MCSIIPLDRLRWLYHGLPWEIDDGKSFTFLSRIYCRADFVPWVNITAITCFLRRGCNKWTLYGAGARVVAIQLEGMRAVWRGVNVTLGGGGKSGLITLLSSSTATLLARARALSNSVSGNVSLSVSSEKTRVYRMLGLDKTVWGGWWRIGLAGKLGSVLKGSAGYTSKVHVVSNLLRKRGTLSLLSTRGAPLHIFRTRVELLLPLVLTHLQHLLKCSWWG